MRPFFNAGGVLILVLLLIGGAATYAHFGIGDRQAMLDRDAVTVQAIVTDKQERRRLGGSGTASTDYFVSVRITEGSAIDGTLSLAP